MINDKKFTGLILRESLVNESALRFVEIVKTETWEVPHHGLSQPLTWTALHIQGEVSSIEEFTHSLATSMKSAGWYANFTLETEEFVVFPGKVFRYKIGDLESKQAAKAFGLQLMIPERQLDW